MKRTLATLAALSAFGAIAQTQIRTYDLVTENTSFPANYDVTWAQGESVRLNITAKRGNYYTSISSTSTPVFKAWEGANTSVLYANATGTITVADSGKVQIDLTSTQAAITPTGAYNYAVAVYDGTNYMGVVASGRATIRGFPFGEIAYVGTQPTWAGVTQAVFLGGASGGITGRTITINSSESGGGATGSITQGQHNAILGGLTVSNAIVFATNATASSTAGATYWDVSNNAISTVMSVPGVLLQNGQELYIYAQNKAGRTISNGAPVKIVSDPGGTTPRVDFASATNTVGMGHVVAVATHDVTNNQFGYFTSYGIVRDLNTASWSNGDDLFLDGDGSLTNQQSAAPAFSTHVGYVIRSHATQGSIFVQLGAPEHDPVWMAASNRVATGITAVGLVASGSVQRTGDTNMSGAFVVSGNTPALSVAYTNGAWQLVRLGVGQEAQGGGAVFIFRSTTNYVELYADTNAPSSRGSLARKSSSSGFATVWDRHNDGTGSGLDADLLDGIDSTAFATGAPIYSLNGLDGSGLTNLPSSGGAITNSPEFIAVTISPTQFVDVVIFAGQSNMEGQPEAATSTTNGTNVLILAGITGANNRVRFWLQDPYRGYTATNAALWYVSATNWGPELSFGNWYDEARGRRSNQVAIVKVSYGGADLYGTWNPTNTTFRLMTNTVTQATNTLAAQGLTPRIVGFVWMQGESDAANATYAAAYRANLTNLIGVVRGLYGPTLPVVVGKISLRNRGYEATVRGDEEWAASNLVNVAIARTDDLPLFNDLAHYTAAGLVELGRKFATALAKIRGEADVRSDLRVGGTVSALRFRGDGRDLRIDRSAQRFVLFQSNLTQVCVGGTVTTLQWNAGSYVGGMKTQDNLPDGRLTFNRVGYAHTSYAVYYPDTTGTEIFTVYLYQNNALLRPITMRGSTTNGCIVDGSVSFPVDIATNIYDLRIRSSVTRTNYNGPSVLTTWNGYLLPDDLP